MRLFDQSGSAVELTRVLGSGGEGEVRAISNRATVAKILKPERRTAGKFGKLSAMVADRPHGVDSLVDGFPVLTWPKQVLFSSQTKRDLSTFVGYTMVQISKRDFVPFFQITTAQRRAQLGGVSVTWDRMVQLATRICHVVRILHSRGYAVGDLNDRNLLVSRRFTPLLMDTDSFEVPRGFRRHFPSTVGDQLYWPPELLGVDLKENKESRVAGDRYALATLLFQLFMNGNRPYQARGRAVEHLENLMAKTRAGNFPWDKPQPGILEPPARAPSFSSLPKPIRKLFIKCFVDGHGDPRKRPTVEQWFKVLRAEAKRGFQVCPADDRHVMGVKAKACPWCLDDYAPFTRYQWVRSGPSQI